MDEEAIFAEPAGRKLDALVHEHVMGKAVRWQHGHPFTDEVGLLGANVVPHYSTDIAAAWAVVEHLRADDWLVNIKAMPAGVPFILGDDPSEYGGGHKATPIGHGKVACELSDVRHDLSKYRLSEFTLADTMPLAVCRAALLAEARPCST